jgi:hypothetical protein
VPNRAPIIVNLLSAPTPLGPIRNVNCPTTTVSIPSEPQGVPGRTRSRIREVCNAGWRIGSGPRDHGAKGRLPRWSTSATGHVLFSNTLTNKGRRIKIERSCRSHLFPSLFSPTCSQAPPKPLPVAVPCGFGCSRDEHLSFFHPLCHPLCDRGICPTDGLQHAVSFVLPPPVMCISSTRSLERMCFLARLFRLPGVVDKVCFPCSFLESRQLTLAISPLHSCTYNLSFLCFELSLKFYLFNNM